MAWRCCDEFGGLWKRPEIIVGRTQRSAVPAIGTVNDSKTAGTALRLVRPAEKLTVSSGWLAFKTENLLRLDATLRNNPVR